MISVVLLPHFRQNVLLVDKPDTSFAKLLSLFPEDMNLSPELVKIRDSGFLSPMGISSCAFVCSRLVQRIQDSKAAKLSCFSFK